MEKIDKIFEKFEDRFIVGKLCDDPEYPKCKGWNQLKSQLKSLIQAKDKEIEILEAKLKGREKTITALEKEIERLQIVQDKFYSIQHDFIGLKQQLKSFKKSVIKIVKMNPITVEDN